MAIEVARTGAPASVRTPSASSPRFFAAIRHALGYAFAALAVISFERDTSLIVPLLALAGVVLAHVIGGGLRHE